MSKWIDEVAAAAVVDMELGAFKRIVRSSSNPPPFVRPSERSKLFDSEALRKWQETWIPDAKEAE